MKRRNTQLIAICKQLKLKANDGKSYLTDVVDENGVSNVELEEAREMKRLTDFVAERVDRVFGEGTSEKLMNGGCYLHVLVRFICEMAQYFKAASNELIKEYTMPEESSVME